MTDLSGQRILVVEDSWHLGIALKSLLRSVGAEVIGPAATSADAERLIAEQVPVSRSWIIICGAVSWPPVSSTN